MKPRTSSFYSFPCTIAKKRKNHSLKIYKYQGSNRLRIVRVGYENLIY